MNRRPDALDLTHKGNVRSRHLRRPSLTSSSERPTTGSDDNSSKDHPTKQPKLTNSNPAPTKNWGSSRSTLRNWGQTGEYPGHLHPVNKYRLYKRTEMMNSSGVGAVAINNLDQVFKKRQVSYTVEHNDGQGEQLDNCGRIHVS
ncbi:MAG: hypothetical protein R3C02_07775 [Planctomycetaceae bacterium]